MTGCPPAPLQGTMYLPLSVNLQWELPLLLRKSRCPGSRKSQLEGSQKSMTLHFWDSLLTLVTRTHLSQYSPVFIPHTPLRATKHSVELLALWFHLSQAQVSSLKQVENPLVFLGAEAGLQAIVASPMLVWGTPSWKPTADTPKRPRMAALNISSDIYIEINNQTLIQSSILPFKLISFLIALFDRQEHRTEIFFHLSQPPYKLPMNGPELGKIKISHFPDIKKQEQKANTSSTFKNINNINIPKPKARLGKMSAFFSFDSMIIVALLIICTASYIRAIWPSFIESHKRGFRGMLRSAAVVGDRLSPFVALACVGMALFNLTR